MPRRASSPALSDGGVDIGDALFGDTGSDNGANGHTDADFEVDGILNGGDESDGDGDAAYIALKQAASFRKSSNLKGNTVKKGGGFQAMGMAPLPQEAFEKC
jgi:ATP-dependent RNA helicase DDX54/DBP10